MILVQFLTDFQICLLLISEDYMKMIPFNRISTEFPGTFGNETSANMKISSKEFINGFRSRTTNDFV